MLRLLAVCTLIFSAACGKKETVEHCQNILNATDKTITVWRTNNIPETGRTCHVNGSMCAVSELENKFMQIYCPTNTNFGGIDFKDKEE